MKQNFILTQTICCLTYDKITYSLTYYSYGSGNLCIAQGGSNDGSLAWDY